MKMLRIHLRSTALVVVAGALVMACASAAGPGWTFAPLGPTPSTGASATTSGAPSSGALSSGAPSSAGASASASVAPSSGAPSSGGPAGSEGQAIQVSTNGNNPLAFEPADLNAPANTLVTIHYLNNSNLPHNVHFFAGADQNAPSLGASDVVTGPSANGTATFTTPSAPGDYFFWCDVHQSAMKGILHVQ